MLRRIESVVAPAVDAFGAFFDGGSSLALDRLRARLLGRRRCGHLSKFRIRFLLKLQDAARQGADLGFGFGFRVVDAPAYTNPR